jgi:hypothetical protein
MRVGDEAGKAVFLRRYRREQAGGGARRAVHLLLLLGMTAAVKLAQQQQAVRRQQQQQQKQWGVAPLGDGQQSVLRCRFTAMVSTALSEQQTGETSLCYVAARMLFRSTMLLSHCQL